MPGVAESYRLPGLALAVLWLMVPAALTSQEGVERHAHSVAGPWHAVEALEASALSRPLSLEEALRAVRAELELGRAARATSIISGRAPPGFLEHPAGIELAALAAYEAGRFETAARLFSLLAQVADSVSRGLLDARAADALERGGHASAARQLYRRARSMLGEIGGWVAVREARVTEDRAIALRLLAAAPKAARRLAVRVRADVSLRWGDTAAAIADFREAGEPVLAAWLTLAKGDSAAARRLVYEALSARDTAMLRQALDAAARAVQPRGPEELLTVARAHRRLNQSDRAVQFVRRAVTQGDTSADRSQGQPDR